MKKLVLVLAIGSAVLVSCKEETPREKIQSGLEDLREGVEDGAEDVEEAVEEKNQNAKEKLKGLFKDKD